MIEQLPELNISILRDEAAGTEEVILQIPVDSPIGSYQSNLGLITLKEIDLRPREYKWGYGISGSSGRVKLDLSQSILNGNKPERTIELHRKGIGSQQLGPGRRLWVDIGTRLGWPTGYEKPVSRIVPVQRQ